MCGTTDGTRAPGKYSSAPGLLKKAKFKVKPQPQVQAEDAFGSDSSVTTTPTDAQLLASPFISRRTSAVMITVAARHSSPLALQRFDTTRSFHHFVFLHRCFHHFVSYIPFLSNDR